MYSNTSVIAFGGNLPTVAGLPAQSLVKAFEFLAEEGLFLRAISRFYRSPAFPAGSGPDYVNGCALMQGLLAPDSLLAALHRVEARLGRERQTRWGARGIDLDLIAVGDAILPNAQTQAEWRALPLDVQMTRAPEELILPHPRIADRAFVLIPLAEIAPAWRHPATGETVMQMLDRRDPVEKASIVPFYAPFDGVRGLSISEQGTK
ncbi:2-amino-4-hydroxy-6-hydroxymethyldihydropteridine diphosphokinase [Rhodobacter sp. TJ_12]|uniref:2-amino-4-hydroxy-6- hydroxymethyldihydropteridine diphosphokinase n=1 Tax=Rhodobacter sp. TJ_12 TaxID=2029399 RepID=UPI001CBB4466|nr:2-amino-4-hydroxy-6-hydroxymethyldihydropteridine diphosphokinase [Rhodobacter sp. TJ_12]MBZ4021057.1 2-amino-4-hydroxy-6-hydroxymethyldihydropteridine diphosphokinase [Rhodobacter sp. TJ_12]